MQSDNPFYFLLDTLFDIYTAILLIRFLLQQVGADFYNPISQFIVKVTHPLVKIVRRIIPAYKGADLATLALAYAFIILKLVIIAALAGVALSAKNMFIISLHDLVSLTIDIFIFAVFIQAILSWVNPDPYNPVASLLGSLTAPVLRPVRRYVKPISGLDLSPIVALIGLMFIKRVVSYLFNMF